MYIPYYREGDKIFVFLQKRTAGARIEPGKWGFWGGRMKPGEYPLTALRREVKEELDYTPVAPRLFRIYKLPRFDNYVFTEEIEKKEFESQIKVLEGESGRFFSKTEVLNERKMISERKLILLDVFQYVHELVRRSRRLFHYPPF
jgi:8-oxo-dGTP pyrophosphatase MutT (NUDIX family)